MRNISWLDHLVNLIVVILGISVAFYLEGYREEQSNKKLERKYLESLIKDLNTDMEALDTLQSVNKYIATSIEGLTDAVSGREYFRDSLTLYMLAIQYNPPFTPQSTTYESLKSSGKMDLIDDFELRNRVVELYEQYYRGAREYDDVLSDHADDFIKPFFMDNVTFIGPLEIDDEFLSSNKFSNILFSYRFLFNAKRDYFDTITLELKDLSEELDNYILHQ
jgi:hypothetical protein